METDEWYYRAPLVIASPCKEATFASHQKTYCFTVLPCSIWGLRGRDGMGRLVWMTPGRREP
ncbi:hypothetical protein E2C01_050323 [Portunus trituberculatus]|uniref:Uncharacterized protein n=1 Tax=Portunus trituberculatus TaxID=210409 RepID=A0A5B7GG45_PORTR|nr:hypothetical protein [Portunus trituberculatus]